MPPLTLLFSFYTSLTKSLLALLFARLYAPQRVPHRNLSNQTAVITGANSGIGLSIAVALARQGATVCLACRNPDRGAAAVEHVLTLCPESSRKSVFTRMLDVGNLASVRKFCESWEEENGSMRKIDMLVHNAGIAAPPGGREMTKEKREKIMYKTNFLGSFLMTYLLEEKLSATARVVMTSSTGSYSAASHFLRPAPEGRRRTATGLLARALAKLRLILRMEESSAPAYGLTKAQQVLFASLLQDHFNSSPNNKRTTHAFTPGFTSTPIFDKFDVTWRTWLSNPLFASLKLTEKCLAVDADEGAKTGTWLATWGDELGRKGLGGKYWEWMAERTSFVGLMDEEKKRREWRAWERDAGVEWAG